MYVLCVGMYRACSTWQYEVVAHLLERHGLGHRLGYLTGDQFAEVDDDDQGGAGRAWKVLKSHEEHGRFARALAEGRALAVYAHRDLRDVAFSLDATSGSLSFEALVTQGMVHQVLANDRFWSATAGDDHADATTDLVAGPEAGVEPIWRRHLGLELAAGRGGQGRRRVLVRGQPPSGPSTLGRTAPPASGVDLDDPSIAQTHDGRTLLHWNHMREGRVGEWRERATPRQRLAFARICGPWLASRGYEPDDDRAIAAALAAEPSPLADRARWEWAMARGRIACELRCLSLRHPRLARSIKPWLGIAAEAPLAPRAAVADQGRHAGGPAIPSPHFALDHAGENGGVRPGTLNRTL